MQKINKYIKIITFILVINNGKNIVKILKL